MSDRHGEPLDGIVVGTMDLGESDRLVRLLTPTDGRIAVVARHARSSRKRFAGAFELGNRLTIGLGRRTGSLPPIAVADRLSGPDRARADLDRIALVAYGCELCAGLAPEGSPATKLHGLLVAWLEALEGEATPDDAMRIALEAKALTFAGLTPSLILCPRCGERLDDPAVFDAESGGGLHARCGGGRPVRAEALVRFEALRRTPLVDGFGAPIAPGDRWLLSDFAQHHVGRGLASRAWLASLG